ncbi:hypothetical protein [Catellatospora citrea]|uniref:Uncharacterized protein n=1 Tax=Catellatospora citrea TaxID=53366 RepID=A0A8J3KF46_9ACTN|nr:hypothetical protein [Catellatospora citrea]RKE00342.1 shikimate kinase [Catellatospora citrea]GIF99449.1 hypothetical protein Cci01nite_45430 [Catellatospora citrea]
MSAAGQPSHPYLIYLLGYPGVGKYTIAAEIATMTGAVVVDNQLMNHPVLTLLGWDGVSILPRETWRYVAGIREALLRVLEDLAPRSISHVLTNALEDGPEGAVVFARIRQVAAARDAVFLPVVLTCDPAEQARRVTGVERARRLKLTDPEQLRAYMATTDMYVPIDPHLFTLDTTDLSPARAAEAILHRVATLRQRPTGAGAAPPAG